MTGRDRNTLTLSAAVLTATGDYCEPRRLAPGHLAPLGRE